MWLPVRWRRTPTTRWDSTRRNFARVCVCVCALHCISPSAQQFVPIKSARAHNSCQGLMDTMGEIGSGGCGGLGKLTGPSTAIILLSISGWTLLHADIVLVSQLKIILTICAGRYWLLTILNNLKTITLSDVDDKNAPKRVKKNWLQKSAHRYNPNRINLFYRNRSYIAIRKLSLRILSIFTFQFALLVCKTVLFGTQMLSEYVRRFVNEWNRTQALGNSVYPSGFFPSVFSSNLHPFVRVSTAAQQ